MANSTATITSDKPAAISIEGVYNDGTTGPIDPATVTLALNVVSGTPGTLSGVDIDPVAGEIGEADLTVTLGGVTVTVDVKVVLPKVLTDMNVTLTQ